MTMRAANTRSIRVRSGTAMIVRDGVVAAQLPLAGERLALEASPGRVEKLSVGLEDLRQAGDLEDLAGGAVEVAHRHAAPALACLFERAHEDTQTR